MKKAVITWGLMALLSVGVAACDKVDQGSRNAAAITKKTINNSVSFWDDVFTYHSKQADNAPQTRYCYQMQSDVVCYDSVQPRATAKLVGYQDGEHVSWVQPGGGSLGVSGGEPVAMRVASSASFGGRTSTSSGGAANVSNATVNVSDSGPISSSNLPPPPKGFSR